MTTKIFVTNSFVGFHRWPEAPNQVAYLRDLHRHVFHVKVWHKVEHSDRDVEFHILKEAVTAALRVLKEHLMTHPSMSCEMLATELYDLLMKKGHHPSAIEVNEDNENGATVEFH